TAPVTRRQPDPLRLTIRIALNLRLHPLKQVELVVNLEHRQVLRTNLAQYRQYLLNLLITLGLVRVDHMQQQIGVARLLKGGAKRLDQLVRQMTNKAHRISEHNRSE